MKHVDWLKIAGRPLTIILMIASAFVTIVDLWKELGGWKWYAAAASAVYLVIYLFLEVRRLWAGRKWLRRFAAAGPLSEPNIIDKAFQWGVAERVLTIEGENAHFVQSEDGRNVSDEDVDHIIRSAAGDKAVEFAAIHFAAWFQIDDEPEKEAFCTPESQRGTSFRCKIGFKGQVVSPGSRLRTRREFLWPGAVATKQEYWLLPLHHPVSRMIAEFRFRDAPQDIGFWKCPRFGRPQPAGLNGPLNEGGYVVYRANVRGDAGWYGIEWAVR